MTIAQSIKYFCVLASMSLVGELGKASTHVAVGDGKGRIVSSEEWLEKELAIGLPRIFRNISPSDARPGAIIAAQTRHNPNYYFHWVRDAALTADSLLDRYHYNLNIGAGKSLEQQIIKHKLMEYFEFSSFIQTVHTMEGLGEPKYHVDGSAYNEPWGRPQNDGPALRASSLIRLAKILIDEGQIDLVKARFYNPKMGNGTVIKRDLEYVSHHWRKPSFDLWEEVKGDHFYTRIVQRRALLEGADLAAALGDTGAAGWYASQGREIEKDLHNFWSGHHGHYLTTRHRVGGLDYKHSQLDTAFVLGLLHGSTADHFIRFNDDKVLATMDKIAQSFSGIYRINQNTVGMGLAIGRYPEDMYGGAHFNHGNPWVLTTLAFAEAYYRAAAESFDAQRNKKAQEFLAKGDALVMRVQYHAHADGSLNEQIDRYSGYMTSVEDLTWNYSAIVTTHLARLRAVAR